MIASSHRFHGNNGLLYVYRHGKTLRSKYFSAKFTINPKRDSYRAAVVVSKKVSKSAPARNRIRRRLYELVRTDAEPKLKNQDIIFTVFDEALIDVPQKELTQVFGRMIREITQSSR